MGVNFLKKYQNLVISKSGKKSLKSVKFEVQKVENLRKNLEVENY